MTEATVCATNLGPRQTRLRWVGGAAFVALAAALGAVAVSSGWPTLLRLTALPVFAFGALALVQARAKT